MDTGVNLQMRGTHACLVSTLRRGVIVAGRRSDPRAQRRDGSTARAWAFGGSAFAPQRVTHARCITPPRGR
eukprot:8301009-Heterocapsa_arctica.AAC.1